MTADLQLLADREQLVLGVLVEDVVDHLDAVDQAGAQRLVDIGGLPAVDRDAERLDEALALQVVHRALPPLVCGPRVRPHVQLLDVHAVEPEVLEALLGHVADVSGREDVLERVVGARRPAAVLRRDLGRDVDALAAVVLQQLAQQPLAVPRAVGPGGVEEVAAQGQRPLHRLQRLGVVRSAPPGHAPGAVADLGDFQPVRGNTRYCMLVASLVWLTAPGLRPQGPGWLAVHSAMSLPQLVQPVAVIADTASGPRRTPAGTRASAWLSRTATACPILVATSR